jgi:D-alanyl-D-alanine-carboxypeptidase/D-alanyl-D-alanine-endopeptidase
MKGAGMLHSTAHDLLRFVSAECGLSGEALAPAIALTQQKHASDDARRGAGLGWVIQSPSEIWHNGQTGGYTSFVIFDPTTKRGLVVLADTASLQIDALGMTLFQRLLGKPATLELPPSVTLSDTELDAFVGTYALTSGPLVVTRTDHALSAKGILRTPVRLYPTSPTAFALRRLGGSITFTAKDATLTLDGAVSDTGPKK